MLCALLLPGAPTVMGSKPTSYWVMRPLGSCGSSHLRKIMSSSGVKVRDSAAIPPGTVRERCHGRGENRLCNQIPEFRLQPYHFLTGKLGLLGLSEFQFPHQWIGSDNKPSLTKIKWCDVLKAISYGSTYSWVLKKGSCHFHYYTGCIQQRRMFGWSYFDPVKWFSENINICQRNENKL